MGNSKNLSLDNVKQKANELEGLDRLQLELILAYLLPSFETLTSKAIRAMEFYVFILQLIEKEFLIHLAIELHLLLQREVNQLMEALAQEHKQFIEKCNEFLRNDSLSNLEKFRLMQEIIKLLEERIAFNNKLIAIYEEIIAKLDKISKALGVYIENKYKQIEDNIDRLILNNITDKIYQFYIKDQVIEISQRELFIELGKELRSNLRNGTEVTRMDFNMIVCNLVSSKIDERNINISYSEKEKVIKE